jgi:hypothetical protein
MTSLHMAILLAAGVPGCTIMEAPPDVAAYRTSVARALSYYEGSQKRYLISTPWEQGLPGRLTVCTREEVVDGRGNKTEAGPFTRSSAAASSTAERATRACFATMGRCSRSSDSRRHTSLALAPSGGFLLSASQLERLHRFLPIFDRKRLFEPRAPSGLDLVGADLVEVSPPLDTSGMTSMTAVAILFELLCVLSQARVRRKPASSG